MTMLHPAELAWYVTGRFYRDTENALADFGYFLHLAGITASLFNGKPGEGTAHFTFAAHPFKAGEVVNGALNLTLDPVGEFSIFMQPEPEGDFDDPATFARGECIGTFQRTSCVVGTTVNASNAANAAGVVSSNVFSARLVDSTPFEFAGEVYDLRKLLGNGVTQFGTAAAATIPPPSKDYTAVVPFSGSATAWGVSHL
jgi:hypothetical protein